MPAQYSPLYRGDIGAKLQGGDPPVAYRSTAGGMLTGNKTARPPSASRVIAAECWAGSEAALYTKKLRS